MKKYITVILKEKNKAQDSQKRIKKVSRGYAFNYLIPKQIAEIATKGKIKHLNMLNEIASTNKNLAYERNIRIKQKLDKIEILHMRKTCSPSKLIFGRVSDQDISAKILQLTGQKIDKKQIRVADCKKVGRYRAEIKIEDNISCILNLHILPKTI